MSLNLPERASYDYLKKLAKERLALLQVAQPATQLADAQRAIAREYGFASWRALKAELDRRREPRIAAFMQACRAGDVAALRELLQDDPGLARERLAAGSHGLHLAFRHPDALRLLIAHGADPNVRDLGDNASPLHLAAANAELESVRVLLDAGADAQGTGDLHNGDVIGWAMREGNEAVIQLLLERGARHHIFSAMALGDRDLVRRLVAENPGLLLRRRSRFENGQTPLHAAFAPPDGVGFLAGKADYAMLSLLIELGADLEAADDKGRTPLAVAMLRGDREAMRILKAAGAVEPPVTPIADAATQLAAAAASVKKGDPMFSVPDMRATVAWYEAAGFTVLDRYEDGAELTFARLAFGKCEFALTAGGRGPRDVSLWFYTDRVEELYRLFKERQLRVARVALTGPTDEPDIRFSEDLYVPFYGGRQFSIQDPNGLSLIFWQPDWLSPGPG